MTTTRILLGLGLAFALHFTVGDFGQHLSGTFDGIAHALTAGSYS